jgi:hypothetical protein
MTYYQQHVDTGGNCRERWNAFGENGYLCMPLPARCCPAGLGFEAMAAFAINRRALSYDPAIQAIIAEELNVVGQRLIDQLVAEVHVDDATEIAVEGWLAVVRAASVKWVRSRDISRDELTEMCLRAFGCTLGYPNTPHSRPKELTSKRLRRGIFGSIAKLTTAVTAGSEQRNRDASPFVWNATGDDIIAKVQCSRDALRQSKSQTDH